MTLIGNYRGCRKTLARFLVLCWFLQSEALSIVTILQLQWERNREWDSCHISWCSQWICALLEILPQRNLVSRIFTLSGVHIVALVYLDTSHSDNWGSAHGCYLTWDLKQPRSYWLDWDVGNTVIMFLFIHPQTQKIRVSQKGTKYVALCGPVSPRMKEYYFYTCWSCSGLNDNTDWENFICQVGRVMPQVKQAESDVSSN